MRVVRTRRSAAVIEWKNGSRCESVGNGATLITASDLRQEQDVMRIVLFRSVAVLCIVGVFFISVTAAAGADKFRIAAVTLEPNPFNPYQGESVTVQGQILAFSAQGAPAEPALTATAADGAVLTVTMTPAVSSLVGEADDMHLAQWDFSAVWDGRMAGGDFAYPGAYTVGLSAVYTTAAGERQSVSKNLRVMVINP
ncbi:MAG: hypothetical protein NC924_03465 [Candidatus Omnitrophica bacterium]|nr:hypothetical protein [Candidatus Omnitrophota bacterium]